MTFWMLGAGAVVIVIIFYDAFVTAVSAVSPGGPITLRLGLLIWRLLRRLTRSPASPVLTAAGPVILFSMLVVWLAGTWLGWTLIFSADATAVVDDGTGEPADGWSRVYFAGFAVYTLGVGDYAPEGAPWQVLTAVATINGFVLLTMAVSYLIPVVMAVSQRREHGMALYGLGEDAHDLLLRAWNGRDFEELRDPLRALAPMIASTAQKYLSYPVLHFFHSPEREVALEPGLAVVDEALLILEHGVDERVRLHPLVVRPVQEAIRRYAEVVEGKFATRAAAAPPPPSLEPLRRADVPIDPSFARAVAGNDGHRRVMAGLIADANWGWTQCVLHTDAQERGS